MKYVIDDEMYGVRSEFASLAEAQAAIRACGRDFADVVLRDNGCGIYDERDQRIGEVIDDE